MPGWQSLALLVLMAAAPMTSVSAQWSTESPLPTHLQINGVAAPAPGRVFLVTDDDAFDNAGALFESADGGSSWVQRDVPADLNNGLNGIFFLDSQRGWVWGNVNYRTLDGGVTWEALPVLGSAYFLEFSTPDFGVASGNFGVQVSRDGGLSWEPSPQGMFEFDFASPQLGLGVADTGIYRTTNAGASFVATHAGAADAVVFLSPTTAVAIVDGNLVRSTDAGLTWSTASSAQGRNRLFTVSSTVVLAWGRSGTAPDFDDRIFHSADAGLTWTDLGEVLGSDPLAGAPAFSLAAATVIASDGAGNLHRSTDTGLTWTQSYTTPGPTPGFAGNGAAAFSDAQAGYFGFGAGFLVRTVDAGASWTQISSGSGATIMAMDRFANGDMIAVGDSGQVLTRGAGTTTWRIRGTLGVGNLVAVQVIGPQAVVAVDSAGRIHRSADAGATWTTATSVPPDLGSASELHFETASEGWVIGQGFGGAALFHTIDGGSTWTPVADFQGTYVAVDFVGASGWAAAAYGTIQRSVDAGSSWSEVQLPGTGVSVSDLDFWDSSIGYAVGGGGYAARSSDGGASWQVLPTPSIDDQFTDIELIGPQQLWVSTAGGRVLYSATGGLNWAVLDAGAASFGAWTSLAANAAGDAWVGGWQGRIRHFSGPPGPPVNQPPTAAFSFLTTGLSVALIDTSSDADGAIVGWQWDFGDGSTSTERHPTHLYALADTYHVTLTVTDDDGATDSALQFIVAQAGPGGIFGDFTEVTPFDPLFVTPQDEDFWVSAAAPADYDGDGDLDIVVLGYYVVYNQSVVNRLVLMRNDGAISASEWDFTYVEVPLGSVTPGASDLAWADVDGDGDQDLALGSNGQTLIYRNDAGTLVPTDTLLPGYFERNDQADFDLHSMSWADFDNDGDLDLLLPSILDPITSTLRTALMRNDGANGSGGWLFTEIEAGLGQSSHAQSSWADFDGDQDLDLLITNIAPLTDDGYIRRFRNDGGVFVGQDILGTLSVEHGEAQWGDYDDDGDLDVLVAGNIKEVDGSFDTVLRVYRNEAETFVPVDVISCVFCEGWFDLSAATWADYDSDGDIDILLAGTYNSGSQIEGRAKVYDNVGGSFIDSGNQLPAPRAIGFSGGSFTWLDIDGEGDLDYFIAGSYFVPGGNGLVETQMHVYINTAPAQNLAPTAPAGLSSQVNGDGSVSLWWSPAADDHTPTAALTYDLRLYQDGVPVATARRAPEPGSLRGASAWSFADLADGAYTWTVEAVDSAYNAGPFASGSFQSGAAQQVFSDGFE